MNTKSFYIKTFGCQMNEYDSNRISDLMTTFNFTKTKIAVLLGEQNIILEKSATKVVSEPPPEKGDVTIKLAYYTNDGRWKRFYTNGWGHSADLRTLVFLTSSGNQFKPLRFRQYDR